MPSATSSTKPAVILIVDDHPNTASMLARVLGQIQAPTHILTAQGGAEALTIMERQGVDLLITDFMMPGMTGLELIEKLKGGREPGHTILITAYDSPGLSIIARRLKVNDYLVKPVPPEKIRDLVSNVLVGWHTPAPRTVAETPPPTSFKILIADDSPDNVRLLETRLSHEGYTCITANDGETALQQARLTQPDLVLLDVNMPRKNGFEVLAEIRADLEIGHLPVILVTAARVTAKDVREGLGLGADDYVTKPFDWRELSARVRAKLRVKHAEDLLRRRNRELGLLPDIGQDLSARLSVDELQTVTLQRSIEALKADNGHMLVFNPEGGAIHKLHHTRDFTPWTEDTVYQKLLTEGIAAQVSAMLTGVVIADTQTDPRWLKLPNDQTRSAISTPLMGRHGVLGVLTLAHAEPSHFQAESLTLLQAIASQAALAIENIQLYAMEHKRVNELVALNQLTREISVCARSTELFERLPESIRATLGYTVVSLWLNEGGQLRLVRLADAGENLRESLLRLAPQQVLNTGQAARISGEIEERQLARTTDGTPPSHASLAVPIFWQSGAVSGVLAAHSRKLSDFLESDRVVLETLAAQIASALERMQFFEVVEHEQRRLAAVLQSAADPLLVFGVDGRLQLINPAGQRLFTDIDATLGRPLPLEHGYDMLIALVEQSLASGQAEHSEVNWPDGRAFAVLTTPIEEGGLIALFHDVTAFKNMERVKNELLATASHDLKNPISALLGYASLIEQAGPLTTQQSQFLTRIKHAADSMRELVINLLDMARIDMQVALKLEPCELGHLMRDLVLEFEPQATAKQQTLHAAHVTQPMTVKADLSRLKQALRNLIGNALKYTPSGGQITLAVATTEAGQAMFSVQDTGLGIPAEDLPHLFEKFYRVQTADRQDIEGNGLGLAIVKAIIEQHGGQISVISEVGHGSTFSVRLPCLG